MWEIPAILTVCGSWACGITAQKPVFPPPNGVSASVDVEIPDEVLLPEPGVRQRVRSISDEGGNPTIESLVGPWTGFDVDGALGPDLVVPWSRIDAPDRLRLGREILRRGDRLQDSAAWSLLAIGLQLTADDAIAGRAIEAAVQAAGQHGEVVRQSILARVRAERRAAATREAEARAHRLIEGRPHLDFDDPGLVVVVPPDRRIEILRAQRAMVEQAIDGLGLRIVPTRWTLAAGVGPLEAVALRGVRMDDLLARCLERLGLQTEASPFAGALVLVEPRDLAEARLLVAERFRVDWLEGDRSMLVPTPDGPWAVIPGSVDPRSVEPGDVDEAAAIERERSVEEARLAARAAILWSYGGRGLPTWLIEGFAEAAAGFLVDLEGVEAELRPRAVESIRRGRHPVWITELPSQDPAWGPGGDARGVALVLVTRLLESPKPVFAGLVADLKSGRGLDESFRRRVGMSFGRWLDDSVDWFRFND